MFKMLDFKCTECGHVFEKLVKNDAVPERCPECEGESIVKVISHSGAIHFKGVKATCSMKVN